MPYDILRQDTPYSRHLRHVAEITITLDAIVCVARRRSIVQGAVILDTPAVGWLRRLPLARLHIRCYATIWLRLIIYAKSTYTLISRWFYASVTLVFDTIHTFHAYIAAIAYAYSFCRHTLTPLRWSLTYNAASIR